MSKKAPLTAIQFNALAIVTLLAFMPFAIAFITNAGSNTQGDYEASSSPYNVPTSPLFDDAFWYHTGINYTSIYSNDIPMPYNWYECAYVSFGVCKGPTNITNVGYYDYNEPYFSEGYNIPARVYDSTFDYQTYTITDNYQQFLAPGEYIGTSGSGPFGWLFKGKMFNEIEPDSALDKIKYTFAEYDTAFNCDYSGFTELQIDYKLTLLYGNNSIVFDGFKSIQQNKLELNLQYSSGWHTDCFHGLVLEYDFTGFESLAIDDMNGGDWHNTSHIVEIDNIKRTDGFQLGDTVIPWTGEDYFQLTVEHQEIDPVQAGFIIKSLTTVLSVGTFALALASTQYWNPVSKRVKGGF